MGRYWAHAVALVLVVEDDAVAALRALRAGCRRRASAARRWPPGPQLLERATGGRPDVLVVDIGLPDCDGRDACQALRAQGVETPVLFLTARDALVDRLAGFEAGGDDYVSKPFSLDELVARLRALVQRGSRDAAPDQVRRRRARPRLPRAASRATSACG